MSHSLYVNDTIRSTNCNSHTKLFAPLLIFLQLTSKLCLELELNLQNYLRITFYPRRIAAGGYRNGLCPSVGPSVLPSAHIWCPVNNFSTRRRNFMKLSANVLPIKTTCRTHIQIWPVQCQGL